MFIVHMFTWTKVTHEKVHCANKKKCTGAAQWKRRTEFAKLSLDSPSDASAFSSFGDVLTLTGGYDPFPLQRFTPNTFTLYSHLLFLISKSKMLVIKITQKV